MDHLSFFVSCVSHAFTSVHCCLEVTCWERADLLALVGDVNCTLVTFPCGILGQVWYLIVSFHARIQEFSSGGGVQVILTKKF